MKRRSTETTFDGVPICSVPLSVYYRGQKPARHRSFATPSHDTNRATRKPAVATNSKTRTALIVSAAQKYLGVAKAKVEFHKDGSSEPHILLVKQNRSDPWEVVARRRSRAELLEFINDHDPQSIRSIEAGRSVANGN